jgi:chemotaxis protein MotB
MRVHLGVPALALLAVASTGCTAKYQDLLRDRDAQIRDLNGRLADLRAANADLERVSKEAREAGDAGKTAKPAENQGVLERLKNEFNDEGVSVSYRRGRISIGIDNTVTFDSGSTALKTGAHGVLKKVAAVLKRDYPGNRIYVEGHTDDDPIQKTKDRYRSNRHLSLERADAVAAYLIKECSLPERQIVVVGYGEFDPREPAKKAQNRRVEIVVGDRG